MDSRSVYSVIATAILCASLTACSKPQEPPPSFITMQAHKTGKVESVGGAGYGNLVEKIGAFNNDVYAGTDFQVMDAVYNEGGSGKGVKVLVKGPVLQLFGPPKDARIESDAQDPGKSQEMAHADLVLADDGTGQYIAEAPNLPYNKELRLMMAMPAGKKNGQGELQIYVYPLAKAGKTSASFTHQLRVLSEQEPAPGQSGLPDDSGIETQ